MKYFTPIIKINSQLTCNIYIKRDDLLPFSFGGNKVRIAEEFFADMRRKKHDSIIGYGNSRSNLCRVIANMSKYYGVKCCIISPKDDDGQRVETSNSKIVRLCDSEIVICSKDNVSKTVSETISRHKDAGYSPYYIYGNEFGTGNKSTPVNAYYKCYNEILSQAKAYDLDFDYIFLATGTGMTQAGLLSGKLVSNGKEKIVGISVARKTEQETNVIYDYVKSFFKKKQLNTNILKDDICVVDEYIGKGYGKKSSIIDKAIYDMMVLNGIPLDPTYTGKAFLGMRDYIIKNNISNKNVLFIHTGGTPLFFDNLRNVK
ncbi:pyridoxal-phosphate dependent enzyme [Ruminococcus sp. AF17-11]|jgi:D-cysteine desulfhydrase|nr:MULTISPECIES: pyridoxal-phosphate dependent enzyme [unclassified Ruminococcus]RGG88481.1 pyridoxal-phosphate dependent enzyme [Ruminococcus sp. AF17-11]RGH58938.1 pyridoxal-phosphate dependent enzyme [Ruminococcus sp. AM36-18]